MEENKNINEQETKEPEDKEYHGYIPEDEEDKKPSVVKRIFKAIAVCIILGIYGVLFVRFFFSCDSKIVDDVLKTDEIVAAHEASPDTFEIRQYEITDWYASKNAAGDDSNLGGKLLSVSDLYYIPATESLQVTLKFNLDILENREVEYSQDLLPFKLYLVEYEGEEYIVLIENDEDADEVVILKINPIDDNTEEYVSIDDEDLLQKLFDIFKKKYEGEINFQ